jgi:hypothetical protein
MKNVMMCIVFAMLSTVAGAQVCTLPQPIDTKAAIGVWQGYYAKMGEHKILTIEFKEVDGQLESYISMPDRGLKNVKFDVNICSSMEFHLKRTGIDDTLPTFVGKPSGDKISGYYKIGNACGPGATAEFKVTKTTEFLSRRSLE